VFNKLAVEIIIKKQNEILELIKTEEITDDVVSKLSSYIIEHFDDVEKFARGSRYPKLNILINEHLFFTKTLNDFVFSKNKSNLKKVLENRIHMQINTSDKNLINYLLS